MSIVKDRCRKGESKADAAGENSFVKECNEHVGSSTLVSSVDNSGIDLEQVEEDLSICPNKNEVLFRKCSCNSIWCPVCGLPSIRERMTEIYHNWNYKYVRTYALTVDRDLYESPMEAFFMIQRKKGALGVYEEA